jgi:formylglycine-generating enzyme required for sulfatase activity
MINKLPPFVFGPVLVGICLWIGTAPEGSSLLHAAPAAAAGVLATTNTPGGVMVLIAGGQFSMGDPEGDSDEKPVHAVRLSPFYMDAKEVTQAVYQGLVEKNPSKFKSPANPVEQVDWYHAVLFCNLRSRKEGLKPCYDPKSMACDFSADGYRLPTEAEWEYACRAGKQAKYAWGNDAAALRTYGWFKENSGQKTHPAGQKSPNAWGLYDMHGNVAEWCHDAYADAYSSTPDAQDPHGPATGDKRVLRGGSWATSADACRASARNSETPRLADACFGSDTYGFRCVRRASSAGR